MGAFRIEGKNEAEYEVMVWFPGDGEHMQTPAVYPQEFEQRLVGFFRQALGK